MRNPEEWIGDGVAICKESYPDTDTLAELLQLPIGLIRPGDIVEFAQSRYSTSFQIRFENNIKNDMRNTVSFNTDRFHKFFRIFV